MKTIKKIIFPIIVIMATAFVMLYIASIFACFAMAIQENNKFYAIGALLLILIPVYIIIYKNS